LKGSGSRGGCTGGEPGYGGERRSQENPEKGVFVEVTKRSIGQRAFGRIKKELKSDQDCVRKSADSKISNKGPEVQGLGGLEVRCAGKGRESPHRKKMERKQKKYGQCRKIRGSRNNALGGNTKSYIRNSS